MPSQPKTKLPSGVTETVDQTVARAKDLVQQPVPKVDSTTPVITPSSLTPQSTPQVSVPPVPVQGAQLGAQIEVQAEDAFNQRLAAEKAASEQQKLTSKDTYLADLLGAKGVNQLTNEAYSVEGGVDSITPELNAINDQIRREQLALRRSVEKIQSSGGGESGGAQSEIYNLERESLAKQADLSVIQMAVQGRYDSAKAIADRAVSAKFEEQTQKLAISKFDYEENKDLFDKTEQREYDVLFADRERRLQESKDNDNEIYNLGIQAQRDGAPTDVVSQMLAAKTKEEAAAIGGSYIGALDREAQRASIDSSRANAANAWANYDAKQLEILAFNQAQEDRQAAIERGDLLPEQVEVVDEIDKEFRSEPIVKQYNEAIAKRFAVDEVLANGVNGVQDLLLVYEFMKSVDPTSVVRESEFDNAAKTGNIFAGQYTKFNQGYFGEGGILPANVKESFLNSLNAAYAGKQQQYFNIRDQFGAKLERRGISNGSNYLTAYENGAPADTTDVQAATVNQIVDVGGTRYRVLPDGNLIEI